MKRLILLLAATALASPAAAQHQGHHMPGMTMPMPAKKAPAKKPAAKKSAAKKSAAKKAAPKKSGTKAATKRAAAGKASAKKTVANKAPKKSTVDPHAGHETPAVQASPTDPHAVHEVPAAQSGLIDPHAGHQMPAEPTTTDPHAGHSMPTGESNADPHAGHVMPSGEPAANPHAGHDMSAAAVDPPVTPPPAEALSGPENAADSVWGRAAMDPSRAVLLREHGDMPASKLLIDQFETRFQDGRDGYFLNVEGWYGGDINKLWLKSEVEGEYGHKPEQAEFQALWSRAINPWFNLQTGVRLDAEPDTRGHFVLGVEGLAPYWIEVDAAAFLSDKGDVTARFEAEHDMRLTQKLILQPRVELDFALQDIPRQQVGSGVSKAETGLRLRYQVDPQFAPYVGVNYERTFGDTRRFAKAEGGKANSLSFVVGLRTWF